MFFFRIKRQTRTCSGKLLLSILMVRKLRACTCLSNTYITRTWVVMLYFLANWARTCTKMVLCAKKHVYVMYDLCTCLANTYMLLNCLIFWLLRPHFRTYVRVCRLILKKNRTSIILTLNLFPKQLPSSSLASPM